MGEYADELPGRLRDGEKARAEGGNQLLAATPSQMDAAGQFLTLKSWFEDDRDHSREWRQNAKDDFDFVAGDQWSPEDQQKLNDDKRVPVVFNRTLTMLRAVAGMEINGRHEIAFLPRGTEDAKVNEVLTGASKWMADNCDGEDEESEAFQHTLTCGMGWNEHRLDFEEEPEGKYVETAINPLEMYWHKAARKKNLSDARRVWRLKRMSLADAAELFPGHSIEDLDASWAGIGETDRGKTVEQRRKKIDEAAAAAYPDRCEVLILQVQWWERETCWVVADPIENKKVELSEAEYQKLTERAKVFGLDFPAVKRRKRVYKQAFIGGKVLDIGEAPIPDRFSFTCVTGELHHNKGTWFGLIRVMRDPAMWANKWLVQTMHIMNSNAKGGILAEVDAFEDQRQAERTYAQPEAITWMKSGSLSGTAPKFQQKPVAQFPAGYFNLMEFAVGALRDVTGVNLELLGLKDINQPGVLEAHRKQAGMTVLATMFDSLRRARKQVGRIRLFYIQNFLNDGRLIRIAGKEGAQVIPLIRDKTLGQYDVEVDDTPASPNQKQANWAIIQPLLVVFKDQLMSRPEILAMLLEYSPLPTRMVEAIRAAILAPPSPEAQEAQQIAKAAQLASIRKDDSAATLNEARAGTEATNRVFDMAMAQNLLAKNNNQVDSTREAVDLGLKAAQIDTERAKADKTRAETHAVVTDSHATGLDALINALSTMQPQPAMAQ